MYRKCVKNVRHKQTWRSWVSVSLKESLLEKQEKGGSEESGDEGRNKWKKKLMIKIFLEVCSMWIIGQGKNR